FSSRRRHTRSYGDWSSDVCSSDLQIGLSIFGKRDDCSEVTRLNGHALRFRGDAAIPGGAPDFFHERAVVQFPHQRMFASTPAQHENLHPQSLSNDSLETIDAPSGRVNLAGLDSSNSAPGGVMFRRTLGVRS